MKIWQVITGVVVATAAVVAINTATAGATGTQTCDIPKLKLGEATGQKMEEANGKLTATFTVTGKHCTTPVTLAIWKSPSADGKPINEQELYAYTTQAHGPGTHTITADLPDCYWQADLLIGDKPTAPDGTANYAYQNGQILSVHPLRDFKFGGDKVCEEPEQPEEPETPEQPETPEVKAVQTAAPTQLPSTGVGAVASTFFGVSASAGLAHAIVQRFRRK